LEAHARQEAFEQLAEGAVVQGTVRTVTEFGAFVDIGGVDGLLHVSDMSWARTAKPADVVSAGDSIQVKILKINPATRKISLGLKQLAPDPWIVSAEKYLVGARVRGRVVRLTDFGAFVELEPGLDGLIHLSEMSWSKKVRKPSDVVKPGDTVDVIVLSTNPGERRIGLGLKQALGDPWEDAVKKFPAGSVVEGPVVSMTNFGVFVGLGDGVEGMIHVGDITREKRLDHPREALKTGQTVRAQVLEVDKEKRRIRLGMKQLEPTTVDQFIAEHSIGETLTGRVVDASAGRAKVELGEGVFATCRMASAEREKQAKAEASAQGANLTALTAMLAAKWKTGPEPASGQESLQPGQIRNFRLSSVDPSQKRIEVELIG
ncbi:MAG: S1 RNA-binding domain-containing protein, partial [Bryobacteraceae bacterium]